MDDDALVARMDSGSRSSISGISLEFLGTWSFSTRAELRKSIKCGFRPRQGILHRILYRAWNIALAVIVGGLAVLPIVLIAILVLVTNGRPILYSGVRYGRGCQKFHIKKFRTLLVDAEKTVGNRTVKDGSEIITPVGRFLRQTRLDELPQIWNVICGDMNFVGPRPVRPIIAATYEKEIPNYNRRFEVKPGIVGHVQIFMPHGASKRIRARYNNILVKRDVNILGELYLIMFTLFTMFRLIARPIVRRAKKRIPTNLLPTIELGKSGTSKPNERLRVRITPTGKLVALSDGTKPIKTRATHIVFSKKNHTNAVLRVPVRLSKSYPDKVNGKETFEVQPKTATGQFLIERHVLSKAFAT